LANCLHWVYATVNPSICLSVRLTIYNIRALWPNISTNQADLWCVGYPRLEYSHIQWSCDRRGSCCEAATSHSPK